MSSFHITCLLNENISLPKYFKSKLENSFSVNQHFDCYSITLCLHKDHGGRSEMKKKKVDKTY